MSAFGGKADMAVGACLLSWSLLGVKRTCLFALRMPPNPVYTVTVIVRIVTVRIQQWGKSWKTLRSFPALQGQ
jgi:hypothetical protein